MVGLANSDGCSENDPILIQRCVLCEPGMAKAASSMTMVIATAGKTTFGRLNFR